MRYRVLDLPVQNAAAFCPLPTRNPVASSFGLVEVIGSPGTDPVPVIKPQRKFLPALTRKPAPDTAQGSDVAPDVILPAVYYTTAANMGPEADAGVGLSARRHNPLPVPAYDPARIPVPAQSAPRVGGRGALPWPRAFQRFPARP